MFTTLRGIFYLLFLAKRENKKYQEWKKINEVKMKNSREELERIKMKRMCCENLLHTRRSIRLNREKAFLIHQEIAAKHFQKAKDSPAQAIGAGKNVVEK